MTPMMATVMGLAVVLGFRLVTGPFNHQVGLEVSG